MYETFYKLHGKPFQLTPDPRIFFDSSGHKRAMSYLLYGVEQNEGFIVVTGEVGAGKTLLTRAIARELERKGIVVAQLVSTQLEADDILRRVAAAYNIHSENISKAQLLRNIEGFFKSQADQNRRVLLVIDEAQNLPARSLEELRMLTNYQVGERGMLQCFLLGQPEFRATLNAPGMEQLRQRVIATYHLGALNADEVKGYVEYRLRHVGWHGDPCFSAKAYQAIHEFTGGIPRRINVFCDRLMLYGYLEEIHEFDEASVAAVANEMRDEYSPGTARAPASAGSAAPAPVTHALPGHGPAPAVIDDELLQRLSAIEVRLSALEKVMQRELTLLRKAILLNIEKHKKQEIEPQ